MDCCVYFFSQIRKKTPFQINLTFANEIANQKSQHLQMLQKKKNNSKTEALEKKLY